MTDPTHGAEPTGQGEHVVRQGEDIHSIAWRYGIDANELWEHDGNAALREQRRGGVLLPGDLVTVPSPLERPSFRVSPGASHRFKAAVPGYNVHLRLDDDGTPRANVRYTADADGVTHEGSTDGEGNVSIPVRPATRFVILTLHLEDDRGEPYEEVMRLQLGGLDPSDGVTGMQARLRNLGHSPGAIDGEIGPRTRRAIQDFQREEGMEPTGELDDATRSRLDERHDA